MAEPIIPKLYRVIFKGHGKPINGNIVSETMIEEYALYYFEGIKSNGYEPELVEIKDFNEVKKLATCKNL